MHQSRDVHVCDGVAAPRVSVMRVCISAPRGTSDWQHDLGLGVAVMVTPAVFRAAIRTWLHHANILCWHYYILSRQQYVCDTRARAI